MAYTTTYASAFTDSVQGTAVSSTALKTLVPQIVDRRFHKQVLTKSFFTRAGMIGPDSYREGDTSGTAPGYPVILKTELNRQPGDVIKMGMLRKLAGMSNATGISNHLLGGKVANLQLVDAEIGFDFYSLKVGIERWRQGVLAFDGGMGAQRNPYATSIAGIEEEALRDWAAEMVDTSILYALWCGYSPHLIRCWGVSACDPTSNANTLYGNDTTIDVTRTEANIVGDGTDDVNAKTFEVSLAFMEQNSIDPVMIDGSGFYVALISPRAKLMLLNDNRFRDAMKDARERGPSNPLFKHADFVYNNHVIVTYDKIRSILAGHDPDGTITVSSNTITAEGSYTGIGDGVAATNLHQTMILGANALVHADTSMKIVGRKEDDYGNLVGTGVDMIFGTRRADFNAETATTIVNQSSLCIVNTLVSA